jgi:hypothetical protein
MTVLIPGINEIGSGVNVVTGNLSSSHIFKHSLFDWSDEPLETIQIGDKTYNYPKGFVTVCYYYFISIVIVFCNYVSVFAPIFIDVKV